MTSFSPRLHLWYSVVRAESVLTNTTCQLQPFPLYCGHLIMPIRVKHNVRPLGPPKNRKPLSRKWLWAWSIILIALGIWAGFFDFPSIYNRAIGFVNVYAPFNLGEWQPRSFRLGLDLLGGSELVYEADLSGIPFASQGEALDGARDVIERRVNALGVAEPVVQTVKTGGSPRVIIQLAGVKDVNQAIQEIGETPVLEFKERPRNIDTSKDSEDPLIQAARETVSKIEARFAEEPKIDLSQLASEFGLAANDLGFVSKGLSPELWAWADDHRVGDRNLKAIEQSNGWHFVEITDQRDGEKEVEASHILICFAGARGCERDTSHDDALVEIQGIKSRASAMNFASLAKEYSTESAAATTGGSLGWFRSGQMVQKFEDAVFAMRTGEISEVVETEFGFHLIYKTGERTLKEYQLNDIFVANPLAGGADNWVQTGLSGKHLTRARVEFDPSAGIPNVAVDFNSEGKDLFGEITKRNVGQQVAIFLDGGIISAPVVQQEILGGSAVIQGDFSLEEAKVLAQRLNAGALPVPINLLSQQTVGATLGNESLQKSLVAGLIGFLLVALFMIIYYRIPGVLSVVALGIYTTLLFALFKLIPVTLTLSGIAGVILSLGMAVDANVLIFERMKEEVWSGRSLMGAVEEGFKRAWPSIRDGNITTIIAALVLFWLSSSVIRGFALTLAIGVLLSMFSAILVTRAFMYLVVAWPWKRRLGLFTRLGKHMVE